MKLNTIAGLAGLARGDPARFDSSGDNLYG
jgi:hypothetical protein